MVDLADSVRWETDPRRSVALMRSTYAHLPAGTPLWLRADEFTDDDPYGNGGVFVLNNAVGDGTDLSGAEVTLENVASGRRVVKTVRPTGEGLIVSGIPFGTYRASVSLGGRPMQVALWGPGHDGTFHPFVVHDFTMGWLGNQFQVQAKP